MIKLFSSKVAAAISIAVAMYAAPAAADTFNIGSLPQPSPYTQVVSHVGTFMDTFNFTLASDSGLAGAAVSLDIAFGNLNIFRISNPVIALYSINDAINPLALGSTNFSLTNLAAGSYYINVTGKADGISGGQYLFGLSALPVPEPEQWMLFAAGLLAIGGVARRRTGV